MLAGRAPTREVCGKGEGAGYLLGKQVLWPRDWDLQHWPCSFVKVAHCLSQRTPKWRPGHEEGCHGVGSCHRTGWAISPRAWRSAYVPPFPPLLLLHSVLDNLSLSLLFLMFSCHSQLISVLSSSRKSAKRKSFDEFSLVFIPCSRETHRHRWWRICIFRPRPFPGKDRAPGHRAWTQLNRHVKFSNVIACPVHHLAWLEHAYCDFYYKVLLKALQNLSYNMCTKVKRLPSSHYGACVKCPLHISFNCAFTN